MFLLASAGVCAADDTPLPDETSFAYRSRHHVFPLSANVMKRIVGRGERWNTDQDNVPPPKGFVLPLAQPTSPRLTWRAMCDAVSSAARANRLPVPFFTNLIWQESSFNPHSISYAGALGVAQFMPGTAREYGLSNPFDSVHALHTSGRFLSRLLAQFGNLGLAAAAYNAGPGRLAEYLTHRRPLPDETRNYVVRITGRTVDTWSSTFAQAPEDHLFAPVKAPCAEAVAEAKAQAKASREAKAIAAAQAAARDAAAKVAAEDGTRKHAENPVRTAAAKGHGKARVEQDRKRAPAAHVASRRSHVASAR
jgi:hypothetical protein